MNIKEKSIVKFSKDGKMFAGEVVYVTDYDTVNIVPYSLGSVWSIPIDRVESVLDVDMSKTSISDIEKFMEGVSLMVSVDDGTIKITTPPPRPTVH